MTAATITVTVNIAAGNKWEGNAEAKFNVDDDETLRAIRPGALLQMLLNKAITEYEQKNQKDMTNWRV